MGVSICRLSHSDDACVRVCMVAIPESSPFLGVSGCIADFLKASITSLIAAVALATNTRSKHSGSAPKNLRALVRVSSTLRRERRAGSYSECGFPYRFVVISLEKSSMRDRAYIVAPPWSRYVIPSRSQITVLNISTGTSSTFKHRIFFRF